MWRPACCFPGPSRVSTARTQRSDRYEMKSYKLVQSNIGHVLDGKLTEELALVLCCATRRCPDVSGAETLRILAYAVCSTLHCLLHT